MRKMKNKNQSKKSAGYYLPGGGHALFSGEPDHKTLQAVCAMVEIAKKTIGKTNKGGSNVEPCEHLHHSWRNGNCQVELNWMSGCNWSIIWLNCPDKENLIAFGFTKKEDAEKWAKDYGLIIKSVKKNKSDA